ncbi:hypothetical protein EV284_6434 [Streptomyces sp. BK022]|uniref:hypothetical protein n=1 Tax=Streptomyces sp. BK022 TaxID=2512123 RepID=UPI0010296950|nr:hypothetical protein [Streptomyces sp. BK022]RZU28268.1 hypothetical protein EV284_6434 [Streptomyces sp. BK022]
MNRDRIDQVLGAGYGRLAEARMGVEEACAAVVQMAKDVDDFRPLGTDELPAAIAALESSEYVDEDDAGARWVSRAFTATPASARTAGWAALAFTGSMMILRAALAEVDAALAAIHLPGPTAPGGTFSA